MIVNRRETVRGIVGAAVGAVVFDSLAVGSISRADVVTPSVPGAGAEMAVLQNQIAAFFGSTSQRLLQGNFLDENDPRSFAPKTLVYNSFEAIYGRGPAELDTLMANGMRMVVRFLPHNAMYKALLFVGTDGSTIEAAALSYYNSPMGRTDEIFADKMTHFARANMLSVEIFFKDRIYESVVQAAVNFFRTYPMPGEWIIAGMLGSRGPKVKFLAGRV